MKSFVYLAIASLLSGSEAKPSPIPIDVEHRLGMELKYVFEVVRHGARAPIVDDPVFVREPAQMLTPEGMR